MHQSVGGMGFMPWALHKGSGQEVLPCQLHGFGCKLMLCIFGSNLMAHALERQFLCRSVAHACRHLGLACAWQSLEPFDV